jgi:uncharacterized protein
LRAVGRRGDPPKQAGLIEAVIGYLVGIVLSGIALGVASSAVGFHQTSGAPIPLTVTVCDLLGLWMGLVGGVVLYYRLWGSGHPGDDLGLAIRPLDVVVGAVVGAGTQLVLIPLLYLPFERADKTLSHRLSAPAKSDTSAVHGGWQTAVLILFLAVGAPIVEELFFRGLLLRSLTRWLGPVPAIVISAVVFGLAHYELLQLPALIIFGLFLGILAYKTGRLGPGMVAHSVFNAVTVFSLTLGR